FVLTCNRCNRTRRTQTFKVEFIHSDRKVFNRGQVSSSRGRGTGISREKHDVSAIPCGHHMFCRSTNNNLVVTATSVQGNGSGGSHRDRVITALRGNFSLLRTGDVQHVVAG